MVFTTFFFLSNKKEQCEPENRGCHERTGDVRILHCRCLVSGCVAGLVADRVVFDHALQIDREWR